MNKSYRKMRSTWIDITFSVTIILLTIFAFLLIFSTEESQSAAQPETSKPNSSPPIEVEEMDSNYPGIKIITKISNDKNAPFAIQYPQSIHNSFNKEVEDYITDVQTRYIEAMNKKMKVDENITGELNISFETIAHHTGNYSFVLVMNNSFSDTEGTTEIRSFHLNPKTAASYSIIDMLDHNGDKMKAVASIVRDAIQNDETIADHLLSKSMEFHTQPFWKNYKNYAISDEALIFYFDENTIADKTIGPPIISIPIDKVKDLLTDIFKPKSDYLSSVIVDKPTDQTTITDENNDSIIEEPQTESKDEAVTIDKDSKKIALTFDDGPDPKVTRQILEVLKKHNAKATFFMLGSRVEYYPEVAKEVKEAGHELGNHTWNHADLTKLNTDRVYKEINNTSAIIGKVTGQNPEAFRPPYGAVNKQIRNQTDLPVVLWDVDTLDWKYRDADKLLQMIKKDAKDGSIILMHDIHQSTADGLDSVLTYLESEGYTFVTVKELNE